MTTAGPGTGRIEGRSSCRRCGRKITKYGPNWWSSDDDMRCPDGEEEHEPINAVRAKRREELRALADELEALMERSPRVLQPGIYAAAEHLREKARKVR
jgi:hypothetical protein